ncbi:MAG: hypothetical protein ACFCA4_01515 [Cyanophyceae cyanobacterium]
MGIAIVGTAAGIAVGSGVEEEAAQNRDIAAGKAEWIFRLSNRISPLATLHSGHLLEIVDQSERFHDEVTASVDSISDLRSSIREFEAFIQIHPASPGSNEAVLAIRSLRLFADDYELWLETTAQRSLHSSPLRQIANSPDTSLTSQLHRDQLVLLQNELDAPQSRNLQTRLPVAEFTDSPKGAVGAAVFFGRGGSHPREAGISWFFGGA